MAIWRCSSRRTSARGWNWIAVAAGFAPQYDPDVYNYLVGDVLEARNINTAPIVVHYSVNVPHGLIRIEVPQ